MKICYFAQYLDPMTGGGRYASDLISGIEKAGHKIRILKEGDDGFAGEAVIKRGVPFFYSALKATKYVKDCDIVHALDGHPFGTAAYIANFFCGKKLIITAQGTYAIAPLYSYKTKYLLRQAYSRADAITAISWYTKSELQKVIRNKNIEVINHGINLRKFKQERAYLDSGEQFILSVGALKERKGHHISIPAFALAKKELPDLKYKIVGDCGDTQYLAKLKNLIAQYGVADDVEFVSWIADDELTELYCKAKIIVLTSINQSHHFEGFGLVLLEAAAAGLPAIGTFGNGIEDAIKDGYNGILVGQGDIAKTASAIVAIVGDKQNWNRMSKNSYQWAQDHGLDGVIKKYLAMYEKVLS